MESQEQLDVLAQIAVALLGFIAIFVALPGPDGRFTQSDRHFVQALVMSSSIAIVLAISPRVFGFFLSAQKVWLASSQLALVLGVPALILEGWQQYRMTVDEAAQIHWIWHLVAWALAFASGLLFVLAIVNSANAAAYYIAGVSMLIPLSVWVFTGIVFRRFF